MSQGATHNIHIAVTHSGLDTAGTAIKNISTSSGMATKSFDGLSRSFGTAQSGALRFSSGMSGVSQAATQTAAATNTYGKAADTAGQKTTGLAAKFQGNKGAIFAFVGMGAAGMEAVGMFGMYQSAADKLGQAQDVVNKLVAAGAAGTQAHKNAVQDVAEAQRGYNFILRNVAMSFGDLVPFTLLAINAIVKMKETAAGSKTALDSVSTAASGLGTSAKTAASSGLGPMATSAANLGGGLTNLGGGVRNTTSATDGLVTSVGKSKSAIDAVGTSVKTTSGFIGTKATGLVSGVSALTLGVQAAHSPITKLNTAFGAVQNAITGLPGKFTSAASAIGGGLFH